MSRFQVVPFAISADFGFNPSVKIYARDNPYKMANFWLVFSAKKKPVTSGKLALMEGKILNLMFLDIYSGALAREARSGAPWVTKCGKLPIRENLVIT